MSSYVIVTAIAFTASLVAGGVYHLVDRTAETWILMAALIGLGLGYAIAGGVTVTRTRNLAFVAALAVVASSFTYFTKTCFDGQYFIRERFPRILASEFGIPAKQAHRTAQRISASLGPLGSTHFMMDMQAQVGSTDDDSEESTSLPAGILWFFILTETATVAVVATRKAVRAASEPFCERCSEWRKEALMFRMGSGRFEPLVKAMTAQTWEDIAKLPQEGSVPRRDCCEIVTTECPECGDRTVSLVAIEGGKRRELWHAQITEESLGRLYRARQVYLAPRTGAGTHA